MKMTDGRMWDNSSRFSPDPAYKVPVLKFVIGDDAPDNSPVPAQLRPLPLPADWKTLLNNRLIFEVKRGSVGGEIEWLINDKPFDPEQVARSLQNPAGRTAGPTEEGQLQPVGVPQRRRWLGAPDAPPPRGAPHGHAQQPGRDRG